MSNVSENQTPANKTMLNDDVALTIDGLYKKFCRNLKRSMFYGSVDLLKNIFNISYDKGVIRRDEFWALENITLELKKGETLGIIGVNGAGKSTLLRLISGILPPDRGKIFVNGKVGSLIAVGAGFHPHMTGAENIYLNGTILGMTKDELKEKFASIVEFADIGEFIEAPVSTYSSGMRVRLGFAIAIHCHPDILLIDEVLSVGDLSFQNKSMRTLAQLRDSAKAVVLVSHNLEHIRNLCERVLLLNRGKVAFCGGTDEAMAAYHDITRSKQLASARTGLNDNSTLRQSSGDIILGACGVIDENQKPTNNVDVDKPITIYLDFETTIFLEEIYFSVAIKNDRNDICIFHISNYQNKLKFDNISKGKYRLAVTFRKPNLVPGVYIPVLAIRNGITNETYERIFHLPPFSINGTTLPRGIVKTDSEWQLVASEQENTKHVKLR